MHVKTPRGNAGFMYVRKDTNDAATVHSTMYFGQSCKDEYELAKLPPLTGWALDVGAHVGSVALALAIDNPELHVIAVEAVPENCAVLQASVEYMNLQSRVHVVHAAAGAPGQKTATLHYGVYDVPGIPEEHAHQVRFIGNLFRSHGERGQSIEVGVVSLATIIDRFGVDEFVFVKTDAEGAEWPFFSDPAANAHIKAITGEAHDCTGPEDVVRLFAATHDVTVTHWVPGEGIGLFRANRR